MDVDRPLCLVMVALGVTACGPVSEGPVADPAADEIPEPAQTPFDEERAAALCYGEGEPLFVDVTAAAGVGHEHRTVGHRGTYFKTLGGGAALADLDGDEDLDLYVTSSVGGNALYLNEGDGIFRDHAAFRGVAYDDDQTVGVSAADYDNDGDQDLLVLNFGENRLLQNDGEGHFVDVAATAGLLLPISATSAAWADFDGDGWLDVAIAASASSYDWSRAPLTAKPGLYRNLGDGTFTAVTEVAGSVLPAGAAYIALAQDLDDDGRPELAFPQEFGNVTRTRLYRNVSTPGNIAFEDVSNDDIVPPMAVMGGAVIDPDEDGRPDVFLTNLIKAWPWREVVWGNGGSLSLTDAPHFEAEAMALSLEGEISRASSWGAVAFDRENDGDDDLYIAYGAFQDGGDIAWVLDPEYDPEFNDQQPNALLELGPDGVYAERRGACAEEMGRGRGVVSGDIDDDGCVDLYVVNQAGPSRLLRNRCEQAGGVLTLELEGTVSNRDAVGAKVSVTAHERTQTKWVTAGSLVLFGSQPRRLAFGLGDASAADEVVITWPSGAVVALADLPAGHHHLVEEIP